MGPPRKRVPKCLKGPQATYTTIAITEQSKRSKKGPFSLHIGSPWSHPGDGIYGVRGKVLPGLPPGFSSHVLTLSQSTSPSKEGSRTANQLSNAGAVLSHADSIRNFPPQPNERPDGRTRKGRGERRVASRRPAPSEQTANLAARARAECQIGPAGRLSTTTGRRK